MYEKLLEKFFQSTDWPPDEKLRQQLVQTPDEAVPILLRAIKERNKVDGQTAIAILGLIGYPGNKLAIPTLVSYLGTDINDPRYLVTIEVLFQMGPDVVVPHLVRAILDKREEPYHLKMGATKMSWAEDVAGICWTISTDRIKNRIDQEYALRCCPAVNALLLQADPALDADCYHTLLAVIERAGETVDYVIPSLLELIKRYPKSKIETQARHLLTTFKSEALDTYIFLINTSQ